MLLGLPQNVNIVMPVIIMTIHSVCIVSSYTIDSIASTWNRDRNGIKRGGMCLLFFLKENQNGHVELW